MRFTPVSRICLTALSAFALTASASISAAQKGASGARDASKTAAKTTAGSQPAANQLRVFAPEYIDHTVDPCANFYKYSCDGWFKANPLPADQISYGRFTELAELNRQQLRGILEANATPSTSRTPDEQKIGDEYATCMNVAAINTADVRPLTPELDRITGLKNLQELPELLASLHREDINALFGAGVSQDYADATKEILFFGAGGLGLPERDFYTRTDPKSVEIRQKYVAHIARMLELAGAKDADAKKDAASILALETKLAVASLTVTELRDPQNTNHPMQLDAFQSTIPSFDLTRYLHALGAPHVDRVIVAEPRFYTTLNSLLTTTDLATLKTYLRWQLLHGVAGTGTPESFDTANFDFYRHELNGQQEQQPRWKRCTTRIDHELGEALGKAYVAKYFPPAAKARAKEMTLAIETAMDHDIDGLDWMSAATKQQAKVKLHTVANKIGYPDRWRDYSALTIERGDDLGNLLRARAFENDREIHKLGKPIDRGEWGMTPPTVNAYYNPQMNDVNFPAGYFQPPFFSQSEDDAANYGDMGSTIGHELTHGFDDEGRQFDAQGNLKEWWTKDDETKFNAKAECMVQQFNGYVPVDDVHINGKLTLGENLADLGGLWLAYKAWLDKADALHLDMKAKEDGYTPEQRFFVAYAQQWCTDTRPQSLRTQLQTDPHSPDEYRTNGILADLPEFSHAFSCKQGQPMVAKEACRVW